MRTYQPNFTAGEIDPKAWGRIDIEKHAAGMATMRNAHPIPQGGCINRGGLEYCTEIADSASKCRLVSFTPDGESSYILEMTDQKVRILKNGALLKNSAGAVIEVATPYLEDELFVIRKMQSVDVMTMTHASHAIRDLKRYAEDDWRIELIDFTNQTTPPVGLYGTTINMKKVNATNYTIDYENVVGGPFTPGETVDFSGGAAGTVVTDTPPVPPADGSLEIKMSFFSHVPPLAGETITGAMSGATADCVGVTYSDGDAIEYAVTAINSDTGEESEASTAYTITIDYEWKVNARVNLKWNAHANAEYYNVYANRNGAMGYIGRADSTTFKDDNIRPDTLLSPPVDYNPFASEYPTCCTYFQERRWFGSVPSGKTRIFATRPALYNNFGYSTPSQANDRMEFDVVSRVYSPVQHLVELEELIAFTLNQVHVVTGSNQRAITPASRDIYKAGSWGANDVEPESIGGEIIFVESNGDAVYRLGYTEDGKYIDSDLSILSQHLFQGDKVVDWAWCKSPYGIMWMVTESGRLLSMSYHREHNVVGFARHDSDDALFESVASAHEGGADVAYVIAKRTVGNQEKRYIERMAEYPDLKEPEFEDCFFVDSGVRWSGKKTDTIYGLGHIEGKDVVALAEGNVYRSTVANGQITLPISVTWAHVGLNYYADVETLRVDFENIITRLQNASNVRVKVRNTRGLQAGSSFDKLYPFKERTYELPGSPTSLQTGDQEMLMDGVWKEHRGVVAIRQAEPLPMMILSISPEVEIGR